MKKQLILILTILIFPFIAYPQLSNIKQISGNIKDMINSQQIEGVDVILYQRKVSKTIQGDYILLKIDEAIYVNSTKTNSEGYFSFNVELKDSLEYFMLKFQKTGFDETLKTIVPVSMNKNWTGLIELLRTNLSSGEIEFLHLKQENIKIQLENEKKYDSQNIIADLQNEAKKINNNSNIINSCTYTVPTIVRIKVRNGYNNTTCSFSDVVYDGYLNFDEYIAGVVQQEIGGITSSMEALKAQAVAARTYSMFKYVQNPTGYVSCGQAYNNNQSTLCRTASSNTSGIIMLYNGSVINALYSARCNGDYTQDSNKGTFDPATNCNLSGSLVPYLVSKPCSGHVNCNSISGETPCCHVSISTVNTLGYLYGHGVGLCQRGTVGFASQGFTYSQILNKFYTGICITDGITTPLNDNCSNAITLTPNATCNNVTGNVAGATASGIPKPSCDNYATPDMKDVWYKFTAPTSGTYTINVTASTGFDAVTALYSNCSGTQITNACSDISGSGNSSISASLTAGNTYYIRVYDYGATDPTSTTFSICVIIPSGCTTPSAPTANAASSITSTTFQASWGSVVGATYYTLEVATDPSFINYYVSGYDDIGVGNVLNKDVIGLTCSSPYYYRVRSHNSCGATSVYSNVVNMTTSACSIPPNDNCSSAILLTVNSTCVNTLGTVAGATPSGLPNSPCDLIANSVKKDVWYKFQVNTNGNHTITTTPSSDLDPIGTLYNSCTDQNPSCNNRFGKGVPEVDEYGLTAGTTYYFRVYHYSNSDPLTPTFNICVTNTCITPTTPSNPTSDSPQCSSVTITRSGTPPSNETWYWQGTSCGTDKGLGSGTTYNALTTGTYYIRAYNNTGNCWSSSCGSISVTVNGFPLPPSSITGNTTISTGGNTSLTANGCSESAKWYDASVNGNLLFTGNPLSVSSTVNTVYYASCTLNSCESQTRTSVTVTVNSCIDNPTIPNVTAGMNLTVKAPNTITGINIISSGGTALYQAPSITLSPGFRVDNGGVFTAKTGNCNN